MANDNKLVTLEDLGEAYTALYNRDVVTVATQQANGLMSSTDKGKLDGIETGAQVIPGNATTSAAGLMSADDKTKLNGIEAGAQVNPGDATTSASGLMSSTDKTKLDGIETGAQVNSITGVKGDSENDYRTGNVNITPANIGAVSTSSIANNLTTTTTGSVLDATQGKELNDAKAAKTDLTSIIATGTTNTTGATIAKGTFFYLNGTLVQAKADIASGATFTSGTNYEAVTAGGLNALQSQKLSTVGEWWGRKNWMPSAEQGVLQVSYDANTITISFGTADRNHLENDVLFTVPSEFRPKITIYFPVYVSGGYISTCTISTDGNAKLWVNTPTASNSIRGSVTYLYNVT